MKVQLPNGMVVEDVTEEGLRSLLEIGEKTEPEPQKITRKKHARKSPTGKGRMYPYIKVNTKQAKCSECGQVAYQQSMPKHFELYHSDIFEQAQGMKRIKKAKKESAESDALLEGEKTEVPTGVVG